MHFSLLTFGFEVINFLVLSWVLSRLLYRPIRAAIERRQAETRATLAEAEQARSDAAALDARYQQLLADWSRAEQSRRAALDREVAEERARRLARVDEELRAAREADALAHRRQAEEQRVRDEAEAVRLAASFAARLLADLGGRELHRRLVERFVERIASLPESMVRSEGPHGATVDVRSAYPLDAGERERIAHALSGRLRANVELDVHEAPELIAGVEVHLGAAALEANVAREMSFFAEAATQSNHG